MVLTGIGVTAACAQIAHTLDPKEKNEIFVETVASTLVGSGAGLAIGLFVISNPVGWGTALLFAMGSAVASWRAGKWATQIYDLKFNQVDLVSGLGIDRVCRS